ncbi:hypothetical protein ACUY3P_06325 [Corynebacterium lehmanniae]
MKNANLKKRVLATMVSATVAFGGVAVAAPSADADVKVTSEYNALPSDATQAAVQYNKTQKLKGNMDMLPTQYGPGWCIDAALPAPQDQTNLQVRQLSGVSGLYGFNLVTGGDYSINPDIEKAAINLTKLMLDDYYAGRTEAVKKKALAMQALVSNNQQILDQMRGYILGEVKPTPGFYGFGWSKNPPALSIQEFSTWTGFDIRATASKTLGQSDYYLAKNSTNFSKLNVNPGEYLTVLVPDNYNVYQNTKQEPTNQRILIIAQPGLDNYKPDVVRETVTETVQPSEQATVTKTVEGTTSTETITVRPGASTVTETARPTVTKTEYYQEVVEELVTETPENVTVTSTQRPDVVTATAKTTLPRETETTTVTAPQKTVTVEKSEPKVVTEYTTVQETDTVDGATETVYVTEPAATAVETVRQTAAPRTETRTVTANPETKVVETTVTNKNVQTVERTTTTERYIRNFTYAFAFSENNKSQTIDVEGLGEWSLEVIDDSNGLVDIKKVEKDGKYVVEIVPKREGKGTVRFVIVDSKGNRHEYTVNVVNQKSDNVKVNDVTVNNHYFNVGVSNLEQTITVPAGWDYKVEGPGSLEKIEGSSNQYKLKVVDGLQQGEIKVKVFETVDGKATGAENNYIYLIDTTASDESQTRIIGNLNSYTLDARNVEKKPEIVEGEDKIEKIEKRGDFWVVVPKQGATGDVVIKAVDKDGKTYSYTLKIHHGTNVSVDNETHQIDEGDSVEVGHKDGYEKEIISETGDWEWDQNDAWKVTNKTNGTLVFNVYKSTDNGRVLVGTYTIVAKPAEATEYPTAKVTQDVLDRNTIKLTRGTEQNEFVIKEGEDRFDYEKDENGNWIVLPKPGTNGKFVIAETFQGTELVEYTINVTPGDVDEVVKGVTSGATIGISDENLKLVEGEDLLDGGLNGGQLKFVVGAKGRVVIEVLNDRDLPYKRLIFNVTPFDVREERFELTPKSESSITMNSSEFTFVEKGDDVIDVKREGDTLLITPKEGKTGTETVEIKDQNGKVIERYVYTVVPGKNGGQTATSDDYKLSVDGRFTITRINDNPIKIVEGEEWVKWTEDNGKWVLVPKGPDSIGKTIKVIETRGDVVVKRYNIEVLPETKPLNFEEIRTVLYKDIKDSIEYGDKYEYKVVRGHDVVTVKPTESGKLQISAQPGKRGQATIEIRDPEGNLVRVVEAVVPDSEQGVIPEPKPSIKRVPNTDDKYIIDFEGGSNNVEIKVCDAAGSCTLVPRDKIVSEGGQLVVDAGNAPGGKLVVVPIKNGILNEKEFVEIELGREIEQSTSETNGSSELDGKCIASIVGLSAPLLLAIPLGILSQVQIPGLEGVSAQINGAIREANDRIQRGLGIYDEDRARRAAGFQGAFNVQNPEMLNLAAGSLAAITLGLLIVDGVMRACGQEEMTSSYKIGEATGSEFLMHGSSGKPAESAKTESEGSAKDETASSEK